MMIATRKDEMTVADIGGPAAQRYVANLSGV
jgi:hypothetical protein